ncbi:type I-D CRISPR-associated protein Cas10d/Csc3 [Roseofilum reptotaenium CS-1145]|uniref:Type I-D CRISPR-associated protein Cas10d/Csc3 n=1 Tax=Roseofilum reptotaenium AO1-A TaxID=1925591 RepID=A0A1L9QX69_9CYAN|nr:type I-D CRISPR-associated protein Cas10d/Csc3 [Roseofilum reptotaenium]MDB9519219.1 type I-D CRISPR-associated protein Cas10d/Csc3 [Roseofilum reptotaenium CS-1145]OJJ27278.1 type I-D CRISPR-associated protein Cas10d/Csc3 [Roseofilum reptotaenium AO1-A]
MAKKRKSEPETQQLSLFDPACEPEIDEDLQEGWDSEEIDLGLDKTTREIASQPAELLTLKLLKQAITAENPGDRIMADFAEYVLPNLLKYTIGVTAKGGKYFDRLDEEREEGYNRRNAADQSLNTHLLNGLFPANLVERELQKLNTTVRREIDEPERRLLIAGFILHDFEKFADVPEDCRDLQKEEHRQIIAQKIVQLGLDLFLDPENPQGYQDYIDDLLCVAYNAQRRWGTNWNFSEFGLNPSLRDRTLICLAELACLADSLSSIIKHPQDAETSRLQQLIHSLSDGELKFTYHSIAENRGVLTNVVNNALMEAHTSLNASSPTEEGVGGEGNNYKPLLYLPTGVIYLARRNAPPISRADLPNRVVEKIKALCRNQLVLRQTGFSRDGKGMKYADYYEQFFDIVGLMQVALKATLRILHDKKPSVAKSRSENLVKFQQKQVLSADYDFSFSDDIRCDRLAEFGDALTRKIWGEQVHKIEAARKKEKALPPLPNLDLVHEVAKFWQLEQYLPQIREIQRINESLKALKLKGNTGGVPYEWYFLAAKYLQHHPGIEDVRETCETVISHIAQLINPIVEQYSLADGWEDVRLWVEQVVMLPDNQPQELAQADIFFKELEHYQLAKKPGRGKQLICSISHSPYSVSEQMESAVLFTPQVYTNKQMLGGSNAKRNISSISGTEMMLRQILMNQTQAVGKRFEEGKYRYLYFYPTYYFTPETNKFLHQAYRNIAQTRFNTSLRNHFINDDLQADFSRDNYQSADVFLMEEDLATKKALPENDPNRKFDRTFKLSYPENQPLTFYFMALPPGRDPTDTESWVMPTWLAFAFPLILDVKTVVSESPIPPFKDGAEFEQTVFLDSAPQAFQSLVQADYFRLDYILEGWKEKHGRKLYPAPLKVLTAAYAIHLDVNAKQGKGKYDAHWGKLSELARDLQTSPLTVFSALNAWIRGQSIENISMKRVRLYAYAFYPCFDPYCSYENQELIVSEESPLNHPKKLTELYRQFYRANKRYNPKANAVLKPIDIASETILKAESAVFQGETLVFVVAAEIYKLMDRVHNSTAEGRWVFKNREEERQKILEFAEYFVVEVFDKYFSGDRALLSGQPINLIRDTCEFLYRLADDKENQQYEQNKESS